MRAQKGDWTKVVGGNHGIYFDGRRWVIFRCIYCARYRGLLRRPRPNEPALVNRMLRMLADKSDGEDVPVTACEGAETHRLALAELRRQKSRVSR
jgi:hypothetical protein